MQHDPSSLRNPRSPKPAGAAASAAPAPNPPRADGPVLARQRQSIRLLQAAVADAAARRKGLDAELDEQTTAARRSRDRDLKRAADQLAEARGGAEQEYAATTSGARETFDTAMRQAEASRTRDRDVARERAKRDADQSKQQRDEAVWFAETCLETDRTKIRAQRQIDQIQLGQMRGRLQQARLAADALLTQWRQGVTLQPVARPADAQDPVKAFDAAMESAERQIGEMQRYALPRVIGGLTPWLLVLVLAVCAAVAPSALRGWKVDLVNVYALLGGAVVGGLTMFLIFRAVRAHAARITLPLAEALGEAVGAAEAQQRLHDEADRRRNAEADAKFEADAGKARARHDATLKKLQERLNDIAARVDEAYAASTQRARSTVEAALAAASTRRDGELLSAEEASARAVSATESTFASRVAQARAAHEAGWERLRADWGAQMDRVSAGWRAVSAAVAPAREGWDALASAGALSTSPTPTLDAATALFDVGALLAPLEGDARLPSDLPPLMRLTVPLEVPSMASLALLTAPSDRQRATDALSAVMLRLLTIIPPGKARFTIIDPVGLGQSFAGFMRLAEFATTGGSLVGERIWTEPRHIEQKLADITEHMETVIQKYLRNQYQSIDEYNAAAGEVAEPYRFVVLADFPTNISEIAAKRLEAILASGARCGVYVLIGATRKDNLPQGIKWADVTRACHVLTFKGGQWSWDDPDFAGLPISVPAPPPGELFSTLADRVGASAMEASKVRVPFSAIAPPEPQTWTASTDDSFSVPLGRAGASKLQRLSLGHGTQQHVLIAGRTGSGKSTLLNVIITASSLWYSPDQVELYLVDFKKGVEFKAYATAQLPHARVIAVESEREFGLSVLRRLDAELTRRGDLFRQAGAQSLAAYRASPGSHVMPRVMLIVDEFQEFFIEDDKLAQEAGLLMDRLVRQGRAFGMHVILGSQTLAGAYSLARSTIGQMGVRIALQCSEADSYLILADDNPAARLLNRPGEAIYNDASGMLEGNNPFQVCWLDDDERIERIRALQPRIERARHPFPPPIVFEGNAPAQAKDNAELNALIASPPTARPASYKWHLGSPISIKEPTGASFRRRSSSNLLIVGQSEDQALGMIGVGLVGLALQDAAAPAEQRSRVVLIDGTPADTPLSGLLPRIAENTGGRVENVEYRSVAQAIGTLHAELQRRLADESGATGEPAVFLVITGLQRFRSLQKGEDDFGFGGDTAGAPKPDKQLAEIVREGPAVGIHTAVWCDSAANLERFFKRQQLGEFDARVLLQMSVNDSSNLIDSPAAGALGRDRALLFSEERGTVERFRPLAIPTDDWLAATEAAINQ